MSFGKSSCCESEKCYCGKPASHKVEEVVFDDDWSKTDDGPNGHLAKVFRGRHPLTSYICHEHFVQIMGPAADR